MAWQLITLCHFADDVTSSRNIVPFLFQIGLIRRRLHPGEHQLLSRDPGLQDVHGNLPESRPGEDVEGLDVASGVPGASSGIAASGWHHCVF